MMLHFLVFLIELIVVFILMISLNEQQVLFKFNKTNYKTCVCLENTSDLIHKDNKYTINDDINVYDVTFCTIFKGQLQS